jgi:hypothetical protein
VDDDELIITPSAQRALMPWFDDADALERWAIDELLLAADDRRLLTSQPKGWRHAQPRRGLRESMHFVETVGAVPEALLLFDVVPEGVQLKAGWTRSVPVRLTRHARARIDERVEQLHLDPHQFRTWIAATVDRALHGDGLSLDAPRWAASAPLRPGFGWTTRELDGDEVALLVAAPEHEGGPWRVITVLSQSTAISPVGRLLRRWKRGSRKVANRLRYRTPAPVRDRALRAAALGDLSAPRPRGRYRGRR